MIRKWVHNLFEEQARRSPGSVALVFDDRELSYDELNRRSNRVARHLRTLDVKPGILVGVCVERGPEMVVGILGILKAGGAFVPFDPDYPEDRIKYMIEDSRVSMVVTREDLRPFLESLRLNVVCIDLESEEVRRCSTENTASLAKGGDLAYVIYTSGSTGDPKGVMITHKNLAGYVNALPKAIGLSPADRYLHTASISFSSSVRQMMLPLTNGAAVVIAARDQTRDPLALFSLARESKATVLDLVPSFWHSCIAVLRRTSDETKTRLLNNHIRLALSASEPLPRSVAREVADLFGTKTALFNMYGQTETTGIVAVHPIETSDLADTGIVSIGTPIQNLETYIIDEAMRQVSADTPGELCIGGNGVGKGYLYRSDITEKSFVRNPFRRGNARMYRTGDLARRADSGDILYLGRSDNQVKVRGFRVELGEIEATLSMFPGIREAVVAARDDASGDRKLVAYFACGPEFSKGIVELRTFLRSKLPEYMIPAAFVQLESLPRTPNGKIDRHRLPLDESVLGLRTEGFVGPRTDTENILAKIWCEILKIDEVGIHDHFFDLGGHSLLAITMFAAVEETFRKNIPIATLFTAGTIEKLATIIDQENWQEPESSIVALRSEGSRIPFFVIHAVGGNVLFYKDLAKYLGEDQPTYGIQARRLGGRQIGHATIEEMAEYYIKEIKVLQPEGPYCLGGSSFGGLVAYEMARILRERGDHVGLLALFDTSTPEYKKNLIPGTSVVREKLFKLQQRLILHRDQMAVLSWTGRSAHLAGTLRKGFKKYRREYRKWYRKTARSVIVMAKGKRGIPIDYIHIEDQLVNARKIFRPKKYEGKVTLFRATIQPYGLAPDPTLGWTTYVSELEIHEIEGHHTSIVVEPYVGALAARLSDCLNSAQLPETGGSKDSGVLSTSGIGPGSAVEGHSREIKPPAAGRS